MIDAGPADATIEAERHSDQDSSYGDELASYATSLSSSVEKYKWEHGRRYHSYREGSYQFPNDEREQDRYDMVHQMFFLAIGDRLYLAPLRDDISSILDIGTGTGIWAMQMGDQFPSAEVIGNDLSPIQPKWVPPNVVFEVDDCESDWPERRGGLDFIHSRYMAGSIQDWPRLMHQCYDNLKPGGWVEFQDFDLHNYSEDNSILPDNKVLELYTTLVECCERMGRTCCPGQHLKTWVEEAGFVNVRQEVFKLPLGPWPKDPRLKNVGAFNLVQFLDGLEAFSLALFTKVLGWSVERLQLFLTEVRNDAKKRRVHMIHNFHVVYGQRPG